VGLTNAMPVVAEPGRQNQFTAGVAIALASALAVGFLLGRRRP
jgi:hypothetical protein